MKSSLSSIKSTPVAVASLISSRKAATDVAVTLVQIRALSDMLAALVVACSIASVALTTN